MAEGGEDARRRAAVAEYRKKLLSCRELEARAKTGNAPPPPRLPPVSPCVYAPASLWGWIPLLASGDRDLVFCGGKAVGVGVGFWSAQFGFGGGPAVA